jgi:prepilin-type N-terminal cleavage/methylation domain-containing protein
MAAQDGFTLVELLIAATLMGLLLTASLAVLTAIERGQREVGSRTDELSRARAGIERMTREIRQANEVRSVTTSSLEVTTLTYAAGSTTPANAVVRYACSGSTCTRQVGSAAATTIVPNVTNPDAVFTSSALNGKINYVAFSITMRTQGAARGSTGSITLADGVQLRNVPV